MITAFFDFIKSIIFELLAGFDIPPLPVEVTNIMSMVANYLSDGLGVIAYLTDYRIIYWGLYVVISIELSKKIIWLFGIVYDAVKNFL